VEIDEDTIYQKEFMGADKISVSFISHDKLDLAIEDYIIWNNINYRLKDAPEVTKRDSKTFEYGLTFYSPTYDLYSKLIIDEGRTQFSYSGTPFDLVSLILDNIQQLDSTWALGDISSIGEVLTFSFSEQSCRTALTQVAEAFELEYSIEDKVINLVESIGSDTSHLFQYGRGRGLYSLTRRILDEPFATRWYGYGGTQNIAATYRDGLGRLTSQNSPYDQNTALYGIKEGSVTFEGIYPRFEGTVGSIEGNNSVFDTAIDFDLNSLFIEDGAAKIVFKTGDLAGNEFPITSYNDTTKKVNFGQTEGQSGYILPNDTVKAAVGDKFTFVGIEMPESYVTNAEAELETKVQEHMAKQSNPKVGYDLEIDEKYVKSNNISLVAGDRVRVTDTDLFVDELIRVQSIEYPLVNPNKVIVVLSDDLIYTEQERIVKDVRENERQLDETIQDAAFGRKVADEIRNYAIVTQFVKTLVGERAVMSGAFVAGNPTGGGRAGVNGAGTETDEVRFFAGSDYDNRATAPFRVLDDGSVLASMLSVLGGSVLLGGVQIGNLLIDDEGFIRSVDYDPANNAGVKLDEEGIVGSNGEITFDTTYLSQQVKASIFGHTTKVNTATNKYAAIAGINEAELDTTHSTQLLDADQSVGGLFTSVRNMGAQYSAITLAGGFGDPVNLTKNDHYVVIEGSTGNVYLPPNPDRGHTIEIKMAGTNPTVYPSAGDNLESIGSLSIGSGKSVKFVFNKPNRTWYVFPGRS